MAASMMDFSPSGEFFAFCGPDGTLRVWETSSNSLKQEFIPSSHLSAKCTCLKWQPETKIVKSSGRKKRKSTPDSNVTKNSSDLIALGTSSGSILLYSISHGELHSEWADGHNTNVNDICWSQTNELFSCASDTFIVQWNSKNGKSNQKMKTDGPVFSICLCNNDLNLLSASCSIKLWDLTKYEVIQTFTGHTTEVFRLINIPNNADQQQNMYFLSAARDDRFIQVWRTKTRSSRKPEKAQTALATLHLPEEAVSMTFYGPLTDGAYLFSVVTSSGYYLLFREVLNGECKELIKPKAKLQIATSESEVPRQLPVLSALVVDKDNVCLSYGNTLKPSFEKISYGGLQPENCIIREDKSDRFAESGEVSKLRTPVVTDDVKTLTPGHLVPSKPTQNKTSEKKRKRLTSVDMTVEERLDVMGLAESAPTPTLQTTSSAVLLAQGLQSKDSQILNHVLQNTNPAFIRNTIRKLPIPLVIPLVDELSRRMQGHAQASKSTISWTKSLLTIHSSYLMTFPELVQNLSLLYQMMDSRVTMFSRLSRLEGKLELILSQVSDQSHTEPTENIEALVTLQDESSDEDMLIPGFNEDEANWESEMDEEDETEEAMEDEDAEEDEDDDDDDEDEEDSKELEEDESDDEADSPEDDDDEG